MPLYETVMQEKPPVVLDLGTAYTRLGFAAEAHPRKIIPSQVILLANGETKALFEYADTSELYDHMVDFLQMIFFKHLLVSPKERKIIIAENVFGQTVVRETLARVLFRHFEVSSVLFVPTHMIALSTLAVPNGIVVDMGYSETTVMPVFSGVQIMQAFQDQPYGGRAVHAEIKRQLLAEGVPETHLTETILEDIKVRCCFVTTRARAAAYRAAAASSSADNANAEAPVPPPSLEYPICAKEIITISGRVRETAFEVFFEESNERDSLPHLILRAILRCPVDVRRALIESVFVIGGSAIIMGLLPRLKAELQHLLVEDAEYKAKLPGSAGGDAVERETLAGSDGSNGGGGGDKLEFKFHKTIGRQNFTAWLGASLCGGTDLIQSRSLTKEAYVKNDRVPDWICLTDNRLAGS